jgi:hypothetical protein
MEGLMVLFGLALAGIAFLLPIVSFLLALGNQRRLRALEETVIRLEGQLNARPAPTTSVARAPVPVPREAQPAPPQPAPTDPVQPRTRRLRRALRSRSSAAPPPLPPATQAPVPPAAPGPARHPLLRRRPRTACRRGRPLRLAPRPAPPAPPNEGGRLRLGEPGRRPTLLGRGGHRPRLRRDLLPALLDRARLAPAARARRDRRLLGVGLLVVCERRAARRYPITANALDAPRSRSSSRRSSPPMPCGS